MARVKMTSIPETFNININSKAGGVNRTLVLIPETDTENKKRLGSACGTDLAHCLYLAVRHCREFDQIKFYCLSNKPNESLDKLRQTQPKTIAIDFYGD